ncbi:N-acetyltransferase family protein [Piscinibacter sakaiensis]|uniref:GNAT family N-acetyltransferase n=1 Tax=Piscinibacter sakaiensis TaxID=1547922 RepID=UPI003AB005F6
MTKTDPAPPAASPLLIRPSQPGDLDAMAAIYGWHVANSSGTFETTAPSAEEFSRRRDDVIGKGLPWLAAERDGTVLGYAYANPFRPRLAYRYCLEDSIYVAADAGGQGIGRLLLAELLARCEAWGGRQMIAVIGDSANAASIALHRSLGFTDCGRMAAAGWKFDRWLDVVLMQRRLGLGDTAAADPR